ncbi:c-type cytochrome [Opitutia bacterium ISCC 51]|nr:c-type cytochrome [Opitutae bacterium ISCC 51]QXD28529.1 c-type cytochrome [Opitutae bacterium ISCC 52]
MSKRLLILILSWAAFTQSFAQETSMPPGTMLLPESALPDYEANIDHEAYILQTNNQVINHGRQVYERICHTCHGDINLPGSIPNSLRFGEGEFQHGNDPYTMYQTITRGWRLMAPQAQLVPQDKYAVIHYIRSHYLKEYNPDQHFEVNDAYLETLPKGTEMGPKPLKHEPWKDMDYGPFLTGTYEIVPEETEPYRWPEGKDTRGYVAPDANIAYKGIAVRLDPGEGGVSAGNTWLAFEHDTMRVAGIWKGEGFTNWQGINLDHQHWYWPRTSGKIIYETEDAPGWANPATGMFDDERFIGLDGRRFGPLPRDWTQYKGLYRHGQRIVISYTVGGSKILESHKLTKSEGIARILNIGKSDKDLTLRLSNGGTSMKVQGGNKIKLVDKDDFLTATIPASETPLNVAFISGNGSLARDDLDLEPLTKGSPSEWQQSISSPIIRGEQDGPFQWDSFAIPRDNPWKSWMRTTGVDFSADGKTAYLCTWDGDVWKVEGIADDKAVNAEWKRIAAGLFQPLGIKLVDGEIFVTCRNQLVRLHDLNGDGEMDYHEAFNSDHQVTQHFHEFAMGLQVDEEGNFYYAKSARHARPPLVAHHGTLLKITADGLKTEILAKGFRAANGVCRNPDGTFFVTDQEGHWNPMNRINWVVPGDNFYGNMWGYGAPDDTSNEAMEQPLTWVDKGFDRSPSELLWIDSPSWGPLNGKLLNLSYGHGRLEIAPYETVNGQMQGGLCRLPIPDFPTGTMRGRFNAEDGHLYLAGMSAWGTAQMHLPGGFFRVRATGKPSHLPVQMNAFPSGIDITFSDPLSKGSLKNIQDAVEVESWSLLRSANYGSKHYDEKTHAVEGAKITNGGKTLRLSIDDMSPVWQMSIRYKLTGKNGEPIEGEIQNTIHNLGQETNWN